MNASIIICCYNSANRIIPTLEYLSKLSLGELEVELILVDNICTDNTVLVANSTWNKLNSPFPLKVIYEEKPGLSFARKKGVLAATGEIVIFCDDDNWLSKNYAEVCYSKLTNDQQIGVMCGKNMAVSDLEFPDWFTTYQQNYAVGVLALESSDITSKGWLWGAGMAFRKNDLICMYEAGFYNISSDRKGKELSTGGDVEICRWFKLCGFKLWYENSIYLFHYIPSQRLNINYINSLIKMNNDALIVYAYYDSILKFQSFTSTIKHALVNFPRIILNFLKKKLTIDEKYIIHRLLKVIGYTDRNSIFFKITSAKENFILIKGRKY
jgi:glycosyltransferase involved in cell wall biosynthesis